MADEYKNIIEIWKTVVDVQKHFNDIEMKIRGLFVTIILAIAGAIGFLINKHVAVYLGSVRISLVLLFPFLGVVATFLFYFMDRYWYHRLLVGAVNLGRTIEQKYQSVLPELALTESIGEASPIKLNNWATKLIASMVVSDKKYKDKRELHSDGKIELFYKPIAWLFLLMLLGMGLFGGILINKLSLAAWLVSLLSCKR